MDHMQCGITAAENGRQNPTITRRFVSHSDWGLQLISSVTETNSGVARPFTLLLNSILKTFPKKKKTALYELQFLYQISKR